MDNLKQDVVADSSNAQDVKETLEPVTTDTSGQGGSNQDTSTDSGEGQTHETLSSQIDKEELDEKGVPYKNRFYEVQRKYNQVVESIPQVIEQTLAQKLSNLNINQQQKKEYSIQELEDFAKVQPEYRSWVESEKAKLIAKQAADELEQRFSAKDKQREIESKRQQVQTKLTSEFPEYFTQDSYGRKVWDESNPVVRQIAVLMQDDRLKADPEGIYWATEIATARQLRNSQVSQAKEKAQLKTKVKDLQKKTMVEGGQKAQAVQKDDLRESIDELKKTGSKKALSSAVSAYFKRVGAIS